MWVEDYQWHYDYVRLAWDTGFCFEKCKAPNLDKNKICVVDVDRIVKERDVALVDRHISTVVQYILEDEQAKVLDTNFVKIFRLSQLAVEYLLFCKKYLDNTVVLLKKEHVKNKEENKELKAFIDDLQAHIGTITKERALATFKCTSCAKAFASEEYLNAHIKRRHSVHGTESYNVETEKLNLEIKELKERLNNTEKLLKEKDESSPERKVILEANNDNSKVSEVLERFEYFKNQVENELKQLKLQKSFYEENYGKLFDIVVQNKENFEPKGECIPKTETTTTQTDKLLQIENTQNKNVLDIKEISPANSSEDKHIDSNKESLETKVSATLMGIENQMQAFWDKLNAIEHNKASGDMPATSPREIVIQEVKPKAKPRNKLSKTTQDTSKNTEKLKVALKEMERKQEIKQNVSVQSKTLDDEVEKVAIVEVYAPDRNVIENSQNEEESSSNVESTETESASESNDEVKLNNRISDVEHAKHIDKRLQQHVLGSGKNIHAVEVKSPLKKRTQPSERKLSSKSIQSVNQEIEMLILSRLHDLGISEDWTRLPDKSFTKALDIINHKAELTKKTYSNFSVLKKELIEKIEKQCNNKSEANKPKLSKSQNIVRLSYRPKSRRKDAVKMGSATIPKGEKVEIKNRALFDTDSESEHRQQVIMTTSDPHRNFSSVIDELKSLPNHHTIEDTVEEVEKEGQKGPLKFGIKKKVLFDLETDSSKMEEPLVQKGGGVGGSTTSVASSIFGDKVDMENKQPNDKDTKDVEKEFDDLSDFDLSDN